MACMYNVLRFDDDPERPTPDPPHRGYAEGSSLMMAGSTTCGGGMEIALPRSGLWEPGNPLTQGCVSGVLRTGRVEFGSVWREDPPADFCQCMFWMIRRCIEYYSS